MPPPGLRRAGGSAPWTGCQSQITDAATQPVPGPRRGSHLRVLAVDTLLAWWGNERRAERAVRRQTASIANQAGTRQGDECRKFFELPQR
jgi:hypothetical protein